MTATLLPVCRPLLPRAESLLPYLQQIDANRFYTNRGPLVWQFERRLADLLGADPHAVRSAASGTLALELGILAHAGRAESDRPLALVPSFTFAATAQAVERCGYTPVFVDVDPAHWTPGAAALAEHPALARCGLIVVVAPYGVMPEMRSLERLQADVDTPIVVDAAAGFEAVLDCPQLVSETIPMALSFHATKAFSTGEGGAVLWNALEGQARVTQVANFGFRASREALIPGLNGKMSEYHAAVGLAMLDGLDARRAAYAQVSALYAELAQARALGGRLHLPPGVSPAYALFEAATPEQFLLTESTLLAHGVETRRWYEAGVHAQPYFRRPRAAPLPATTDLCFRLLGVPMSPDLDRHDVARVLDALAAAAAEGAVTHG